MPDEMLKTMLECGVHFGHQTRRWNPKMKKYIFGARAGIYIIDLEKTAVYLKVARDFAYSVALKGGSVLFVGTKKQAKDVVAAEAQRIGMPYINNRWLGGLLTNFQTVRQSLDKLNRIERMTDDGSVYHLKKKEIVDLNKTKEKLLRDLGGIREMDQLPQAIVVVDTKREEIAVKEANKLGIPVIGLIDTNSDPDFIDYPVPGNDDALKSIRFVFSYIAEGVQEGRKEFLEADTIRRKSTGQKAKKDNAPEGKEVRSAETEAQKENGAAD